MNIKKYTTIAFAGLLLALGSTSCKYEEGPAISLRSKKNRVANTWQIDEYYYEGEKQELSESQKKSTLEMTKDGNLTYSTPQGSVSGDWEFGDDKETIITTMSFFGTTSKDTAKILRLKHKELWLEDLEDDTETHYIPE